MRVAEFILDGLLKHLPQEDEIIVNYYGLNKETQELSLRNSSLNFGQHTVGDIITQKGYSYLERAVVMSISAEILERADGTRYAVPVVNVDITPRRQYVYTPGIMDM